MNGKLILLFIRRSELINMKRIQKKILSALFIASTVLPSMLVAATQYSGINNIEFNNESDNKDFVGNAFLIQHNNKLFAVTVKHTLLEARTDKMTHIDIEPHVKQWLIHPNKKPNEFVRLGRLVNANKSESIDMKVLEKDWLLFEVEENHSSLEVLTLRQKPLSKGEVLTAYGCSYANKVDCQQDTYVGSFIENETNNLRVTMPNLDLSKLRGLSGSPVLDKDGLVVGIVSNVLKSRSGEGFDFAPANLKYLNSLLTEVR